MLANDYTALPHFVFHKTLCAFSVGHHERGPIRQCIVVWLFPKNWFRRDTFGPLGHFLGGVYDKS